jgi:hypothetical protein
MKSLLIIIGLFLLVINLIACSSTKATEVEKLKITTKAEFVIDGILTDVEDSFCIYQWKGAKIFEFNYHEAIEDLGRVLKDEVKYRYFCYRPATNAGYIFSSLNDSVHSRICNADSMIKELANKNVDYFKIVNNGKIIRQFVDPSKCQTTYVYAPILKRDASYSDTIYLVFSDNLKKVNYSFSKSADSVFKSKLVGAKFLYNEYMEGNLKIPQREIELKLEQIQVPNSIRIIHFITRNKKYFEI